MPAQFEKWFRVDLSKKAMTEWVGSSFFTNDNLSNIIGVELYDGMDPVDVPGTIQGIIILPNDGTITVNGSRTGNKAWIELPSTALALDGMITITIRATVSDRKVTLVQCRGRVNVTDTGMAIDPDDILPHDTSELMTLIGDLRDVINEYTDIIMVQDTQPDTETNKLWLKKTTPDGVLVPTMEDLEEVGEEVSDLKSAFNTLVEDRYGKNVSRNIINGENSLTSGIIGTDGSVHSSSTLAYTDYLPVNEGDILKTGFVSSGVYLSYAFRFICCYDSNKNVKSSAGVQNVSTFTIPSDVSFVRATVYSDSNKTNHVISLNCTVNEYHAYEEPKQSIEDDFLSPESQTIIDKLKNSNLLSTHLKNNLHCSFPRQKLKMTKGLEESFYYFPAVFPPKTTYAFLSAGYSYSKPYGNKVTFANDKLLSSTNGYNWYMYDALYAQVNSYTGNAGYGGERSIIDENLANCSLLAIGDSTVDHDTMTATLLSHFTEQGHTITLLGTLGDGTSGNKNEGRAGWKASDYLTNRQYKGVVNPFYNPSTQTFDFSYYMTNQGYASVDFVVLQLGINDLSGGTAAATLWTTMKVLIDSILDFNSSIKIIMNLPTTPNSDQSQTNNSLMSYLMSVCGYNEYALSHILTEYNAANVRASYCHLILDPDTEIRDNVHPTPGGYAKMALEIVNQINHWQNSD